MGKPQRPDMEPDAVVAGWDAIHVATVLEDCVDQLCVLGRIMPASYELKPNVVGIVRDELTQLVNHQLELENKYQSVLFKKMELIGKTKNHEKLLAAEKEVLSAGGDLKNSTQVFHRSLRQSPLTADNLIKVQKDRGYVEQIVSDTMADLVQRCSFQPLLKAVTTEKQHKASHEQTIQSEQEGRKRIKQLQKEIQDVKKEHEIEIQHRIEMISHLKDQLQEMKAKTGMENKYVRKCADAAVAQTQKRCFLAEKKKKDQTERLQRKIDEENRAHQEIISFLHSHKSELDKKLEFWSEKYEVDKEAKQKELDTLKQTKAKDLEKLQELTKLYKEYEMIVVEDRIEKEKARRKLDLESIELKAAIK
ncbi:unnamed protein product, partial [Candidula unifasciata]